MLELELKEFERKICEAVREAEKLPENYRLYVQKIGYTITKDKTPNEVEAEVAVTEGKIKSVKYLLLMMSLQRMLVSLIPLMNSKKTLKQRH